MAIQVGTVDGLINISDSPIKCFVDAIDAFSVKGVSFAKANGISVGTAFQRFVEPVYTKASSTFSEKSILHPALTASGNEQSPARVTYCKKMGLLELDDPNGIFRLTPLGELVKKNEISVSEYAFILLTKMGIFVNGTLVDNLFCSLARFFKDHATISDEDYKSYVISECHDSMTSKTRFDIIIGALCASGLITKIAKNVYALSSISDARIFEETLKYESLLKSALLDNDPHYTEFVGNLSDGIFSILNEQNINTYASRFVNLRKFISNTVVAHSLPISTGINNIMYPLQQIFYGAPGTGKSHTIDEYTNENNRIRTTFHPDYDYATFVGAYKPTMEEYEVRVVPVVLDNGTSFKQNEGTYNENKIVYKFIPQAFIKAYVEAWRRYADAGCTDKDFYLVIEEINRGNCAQIFGDLFQLLDRTTAGFSAYAVETESDLQNFLTTDEKYKLDIVLTEDIKNDNGKVIATADNVKNGKVLVLPPNLHIWATMNTSDQSLFPIDSAFKRRWDWKYVPIKYANSNWNVMLDNEEVCKWTELQQVLNDLIYDATESEDKMLGDWFVKADNNVISEDVLVGKIIFYLWNDVAKVDAGKLFDVEVEKRGRKRKVIFSDFYKEDGNVDTDIVRKWLKNINVIKDNNTEEGKPNDQE